MGYHRAGFEVIGVDINSQPHYPFEFHQADALDCAPLAWAHEMFDAIHASPPCQAYSAGAVMPGARGDHPMLIEPVRAALRASGLPYVIENVPGSLLTGAVELCGASFALRTGIFDLARHRLFECSFPVMVPPCAHGSREVIGIYGDKAKRSRGATLALRSMARPESLVMGSEAMGIDWMTWKELREAIPPAYTEHIGGYLMAEIQARVAA